jgi:hypothetical protein
MKRYANVPRARILDDGEIRTLWALCEKSDDTFARLLQFALVSGQRKSVFAGHEVD